MRKLSETAKSPPNVSALEAEKHPRHRWYFFKEAFSPSFVGHAFDDAALNNDAVVMDPFCGSGTVPLEAASRGFKAIGVEVNPFLAFVSRAKLSHCSVTAFDTALAQADAGARKSERSRLEGFSTFSQRPKSTRWLFNTPVLRAFEGGWLAASAANSVASRLVQLCLLEAAMVACNAAKDGKCLRYRPEWKSLKLDADDFRDALHEQASRVREDLLSRPELAGNATVSQGDIRQKELSEEFDLCVTSPPYLNSFDYTDVYRPELFLGGFVETMPALGRLRLRTLRSHVQVSWPAPKEAEYGARFAKSFRLIEQRKDRLWDRRIPNMIKAYFEDIQAVLLKLRTKAKPTASLWLVVSTSAYAGVEIPVDLIIADIAATTGWFLREVTVLRHLDRVAVQQWDALSELKDAKPHLRESVVILDASPRATSKRHPRNRA